MNTNFIQAIPLICIILCWVGPWFIDTYILTERKLTKAETFLWRLFFSIFSFIALWYTPSVREFIIESIVEFMPKPFT